MYNLCTPLLSMYASFGIGSKIENLNIFNTSKFTFSSW